METTPDTYQHLFYGYTAIWFFIIILIFSFIRNQKALLKEIQELKSRLGSR